MGVLEGLIALQTKIDKLAGDLEKARSQLRADRRVAQRALGIPTLPNLHRPGVGTVAIGAMLLAFPISIYLGLPAIMLFILVAFIMWGLMLVKRTIG